MTKCQKDQTCDIFLKRGLFQGIKNDIPMCETRNYKNANTQIHKYINKAYDKVPERPNIWHIFEKRTVQANTAYDEVPERPNMWYICEKRIVQGYQK